MRLTNTQIISDLGSLIPKMSVQINHESKREIFYEIDEDDHESYSLTPKNSDNTYIKHQSSISGLLTGSNPKIHNENIRDIPINDRDNFILEQVDRIEEENDYIRTEIDNLDNHNQKSQNYIKTEEEKILDDIVEYQKYRKEMESK